ncbi:MAG TPA: methyltransferase domain-containing protein [Acidimicrobiales bacterium]
MDGSLPRGVIEHDARADIGRTLHGDILEIGPGNAPFPTGPGARVTYADRSVEGGRDATWPELAGQPWGPASDLDLDLDVNGLAAVDDGAFDAVVACHMIEHLANPIEALREFERVLRPGGRLVLIVPDRTRTFDSVRQPTSLAHVLDDFDRHVTEVDADHITEFCEAIFRQPSFHPDEVRAWYDPSQLDDARFELHRRRSIHVHCWTPEEFAAIMAAAVARGLMTWDFVDLYFFDDAGAVDNEFGLILERPRAPQIPQEQSKAFVRHWACRVLERSTCDPRRLIALHAALLANLGTVSELTSSAAVLGEMVCDELIRIREDAIFCRQCLRATADETTQLAARLKASEEQLEEILRSRSFRFSRVLSACLQPMRGVTRRSAH